MTDNEKMQKSLILAEKIKLLFGFCADLIPDKDLLKEVYEVAGKRTDSALTMAPILGAFGQDYTEVHFEAELHQRRAKALYDLVNVLDQTEKDRAEFLAKQKAKDEGRRNLLKTLGF